MTTKLTRWVCAAGATLAASLSSGVAECQTVGSTSSGGQDAYGVVDHLPIAPAFAGPPTGSVLDESDTLGGVGAAHQPIRLAQNSEFANEATETIEDLAPASRAGGPPGRPGLFQGLDLTADWSPRVDDADGLGHSTLGATVKFGVPPKLIGMPLLIAPGASVHLLDGPGGIDVPARLYDLQVGFRTFRQINDRWNALATVNVGVYGDDYSLGESEALRPNGLLLTMFDASPTVQWVFGVAVTNREDLPVIPVVGVTIDRGEFRYELTMPRPRIVWRRPSEPGQERTWFIGGELGGGAWAVRRETGETDTLNLSSYGLMLGCEKNTIGGWKQRYEIGYLFGQEVEYIDADEEFDLADSLVIRSVLNY